jgi:hypothetical protein
MQDVLTYEAWLDAVCHICNSLLKANVTIFDNEFFKVVASKYRWVAFIDSESISHLYNVGFEPNVGAAELMKMIIYKWDELLVEEQD